MTQYLDAVQYSAFVYENIDHNPLINELKQLSVYCNQQLKARAARCKSKRRRITSRTAESMKYYNTVKL
jgi:hypothetical protein